MADEFVSFTETSDVSCSLQMVQETLKSVDLNPQGWKWVILGTFAALQTAMVGHLSGTANLGALSVRSRREFDDWHKLRAQRPRIECGDSPDEYLAAPRVLFERLIDESRRTETAGGPIEVTQKQQKTYEQIHTHFRNNFTHFPPMTWLIEVGGLPDMICELLDLIEAIKADGWAFRHAEDGEAEQLGNLIDEIRQTLLTV
ncbi:MAG: hypothetical protein ABJL64_20130 [Rhizobiaceae bacterium]